MAIVTAKRGPAVSYQRIDQTQEERIMKTKRLMISEQGQIMFVASPITEEEPKSLHGHSYYHCDLFLRKWYGSFQASHPARTWLWVGNTGFVRTDSIVMHIAR